MLIVVFIKIWQEIHTYDFSIKSFTEHLGHVDFRHTELPVRQDAKCDDIDTQGMQHTPEVSHFVAFRWFQVGDQSGNCWQEKVVYK